MQLALAWACCKCLGRNATDGRGSTGAFIRCFGLSRSLMACLRAWPSSLQTNRCRSLSLRASPRHPERAYFSW
eukprot:8456875-Pyramimonas_sp.AAC.1